MIAVIAAEFNKSMREDPLTILIALLRLHTERINNIISHKRVHVPLVLFCLPAASAKFIAISFEF